MASVRRTCKGEKANGKPCRAHPLRPGTVVESVKVSGEYCRAHDLALPSKTQLTREDRAKGGEATRKPRPTEVMRRLVEEHVEAVLAPHFRTLGYDLVRDEKTDELTIVANPEGGAKLYGESKDGDIRLTTIDDLGAHIAAAEKLLDRVYGRPRQTTELSGPGGGKPEIEVTRTAEREIERLRVKFLDEASPPELASPPPPQAQPEPADDTGATEDTEPAPEPPAEPTLDAPEPREPEPERPESEPRKSQSPPSWLRNAEL